MRLSYLDPFHREHPPPNIFRCQPLLSQCNQRPSKNTNLLLFFHCIQSFYIFSFFTLLVWQLLCALDPLYSPASSLTTSGPSNQLTTMLPFFPIGNLENKSNISSSWPSLKYLSAAIVGYQSFLFSRLISLILDILQ